MALSARKQRFADGIATGEGATAAARAAGYSEKTAETRGQELLLDSDVLDAISERLGVVAAQHNLNTDETWVIDQLKAIVEHAVTQMQKDGTDPKLAHALAQVALNAIEAIVRLLNLFAERAVELREHDAALRELQ